jgi:hypothetical protein
MAVKTLSFLAGKLAKWSPVGLMQPEGASQFQISPEFGFDRRDTM